MYVYIIWLTGGKGGLVKLVVYLVNIRIYAYTRVRAYAWVCIRACVRTCTWVCIRAYVCAYVYVGAHTYARLRP